MNIMRYLIGEDQSKAFDSLAGVNTGIKKKNKELGGANPNSSLWEKGRYGNVSGNTQKKIDQISHAALEIHAKEDMLKTLEDNIRNVQQKYSQNNAIVSLFLEITDGFNSDMQEAIELKTRLANDLDILKGFKNVILGNLKNSLEKTEYNKLTEDLDNKSLGQINSKLTECEAFIKSAGMSIKENSFSIKTVEQDLARVLDFQKEVNTIIGKLNPAESDRTRAEKIRSELTLLEGKMAYKLSPPSIIQACKEAIKNDIKSDNDGELLTAITNLELKSWEPGNSSESSKLLELKNKLIQKVYSQQK